MKQNILFVTNREYPEIAGEKLRQAGFGIQSVTAPQALPTALGNLPRLVVIDCQNTNGKASDLESAIRSDSELRALPIILISPADKQGSTQIVVPNVQKAFELAGVLVESSEKDRDLREQILDLTKKLASSKEELDSLTYSISHDLEAPLRAIRGFAEILSTEYNEALGENGGRLMGRIQSNAEKLTGLIHAVLLLSRTGKQELHPELLDMRALAQTAARALKIQDNSLTLSVTDQAIGDKSLIRSVWACLFENAVKFSGGVKEPRIEAGSYATDEGVVFFVRDNGVGFDPGLADKLFKPFQRLHSQADFPGVGMGLALVEKTVSRHGGRCWATSIPTEKTAFYFELPARG